MNLPALSTRERLVAAAERLFAERGIDAVSLREINRASGSRNAVAVQYHFADRAGVVQAILDKHSPAVEAGRQSMLDQYEAEGTVDLRLLAAALVRPLAAKLGDTDGGPEFLQVYAELVNRGEVYGDGTDASLVRWRGLLDGFLEADAARLHRRFTAVLYAAAELGRRARTAPHTDDRLFTSYVVDVVAAILAAPVSDETRRLAGERDEALSGTGRRTPARTRRTRPSKPA